MMLARLAEMTGTVFLRFAVRLLRYAERRYGPQVTPPPVATDELPPRVEVLVEHLRRCDRKEAQPS